MHAQVKDIMTSHVVAVRPDASFRHMVGLLRAHRVSGFPVVDDNGVVVGVVSETDLLAGEAPEERHGWLRHRRHASPGEFTAGDLMTRPAVTTSPDELVSDVARLMFSHKLRRLPVVDSHGRLTGIVTRSDVLSVFSRTDEEIRREITQDVIADGFFTDPGRFTVTVEDGIVTLAGTPGSIVLGTNIAYQVRRLEGVIAVRDCFTYPEGNPPSRSAAT
jgi:CBS domain-containing protein